jgi:glycosyltransferase involved in cell wall biosynthesis
VQIFIRENQMKILVALTYYRPHVSGLTIYVERLSRAFAKRGHEVVVLTSQYHKDLPREEMMDGVKIVRVPVIMRVSKAVIMPTIGFEAWKWVNWADVLSVHLPQLDAAGITGRARLLGKPSLLTYHSDLQLPSSFINNLANVGVDVFNVVAAFWADLLCAYTEDFAKHSRFLKNYLPRIQVVPPPVEIPEVTDAEAQAWLASRNLPSKRPIIGLAVRLAAEKGIEHLLNALPLILEKYPDAQVLHAGPVEEVIGEDDYRKRLKPLIDQHRERYHFLGTLDMQQMACFFKSCDVHVLPSINNTETFGLVQIESAMCGTPTVASALPGVRMPTQMTGMGRTFPVGDARALAEAVIEILQNPAAYRKPRQPIAEMFSPDTCAMRYEEIFFDLLRKKGKDAKNL